MSQRVREPVVVAGRYRLDQLLGEGERKRVYRARDPQFDVDVAVALVRTDDPAEISINDWEVRATARLRDCPHVVTAYDTGHEDGWAYIVSQYMAGGDLGSRLSAHGPGGLAFADALKIAREVCDGLVHTHRHGLIHRDVQPNNIWFDQPDGAAHLGDFDVAISINDAEAIPADLVTTRAYMPPEQVTGGPIDERCDLYSFGATVYEMVTGRPPFVGSEQEIIEQHVGAEPRLPSELQPKLPLAADVLISSLLKKKPEERPRTSEDVLEALEAIPSDTTASSFDLEGTIASGESGHVEFKASLRYSHKAADVPPYVLEREVADTLAAFMNSEGGTLLIGVGDAGELVGIEHDFRTFSNRQDRDMWERHYRTVMRNMLGLEASGAISLFFVERASTTVAVAMCKRRSRHTWVAGKGGPEQFFVRLGNRTEELAPRDAVGYIAAHWPRDVSP